MLAVARRFIWLGARPGVAPSAYVILRKLEFFCEGYASKHLTDIRAMLAVTEIDPKASEVGLATRRAQTYGA